MNCLHPIPTLFIRKGSPLSRHQARKRGVGVEREGVGVEGGEREGGREREREGERGRERKRETDRQTDNDNKDDF